MIAVCADCSGRPKPLRKALKRTLKQGGRRDVRVVATSCLDVCPKRATTVAAWGAGETRLLVVQPGTAPEVVAEALLGAQNSLG